MNLPLPHGLRVEGSTLLTPTHVLDLRRVVSSFMTEVRVGHPADRRRFDVALTVIAAMAVVSSFVLRDTGPSLLTWAPLACVTVGLLVAVLEVRARRIVHFEVCVHLDGDGGAPQRAVVLRTAEAREAKLLCIALERLAAHQSPLR